MADRLEELRRQRALVQQHLEWLDREIAAAVGKTHQQPVNLEGQEYEDDEGPRDALKVTVSGTPAATPQGNPDADKILDEYRVAPASVHSDVRKGCFLYFAAALAIFFGVVAILYFALSRR